MFGRKKMIPAGIAAMGILIAAMAFVGGCGTQNTDQNDQTNVSVEVSAGAENTQADTDVVCYIDGDADSDALYHRTGEPAGFLGTGDRRKGAGRAAGDDHLTGSDGKLCHQASGG